MSESDRARNNIIMSMAPSRIAAFDGTDAVGAPTVLRIRVGQSTGLKYAILYLSAVKTSRLTAPRRVSIDWGDGCSVVMVIPENHGFAFSYMDSKLRHTYSRAGVYRVTISCGAVDFMFGRTVESSALEYEKMLEAVEQWGENTVPGSSLDYEDGLVRDLAADEEISLFGGCDNLVYVAPIPSTEGS